MERIHFIESIAKLCCFKEANMARKRARRAEMICKRTCCKMHPPGVVSVPPPPCAMQVQKARPQKLMDLTADLNCELRGTSEWGIGLRWKKLTPTHL